MLNRTTLFALNRYAAEISLTSNGEVCLGVVYKTTSAVKGEGVCPVRTFCGQGGFFKCGVRTF